MDNFNGIEPPMDTVGNIRVNNARIMCNNVFVHYSDKRAIDNLSLDIEAQKVTAFIGPSGCGKSTFLRCLNRMNDTIATCSVTGKNSAG